MSKQTVLQELIKEFENIKLTKCKTMQEMMFFDGVLAIIESKYIGKEREQIINAYDNGSLSELQYPGKNVINNGEEYYNKTFKL